MEWCMGDLHRKQVLVFNWWPDSLFKDFERAQVMISTGSQSAQSIRVEVVTWKMPFVSGVSQIFGACCLEGRIKTEPAKIAALKTWSRPTNLKELRALLGFAGYYRRFVCDYSKIVKPLTGLTEGYPPLCRGRSGKRGWVSTSIPKSSFVIGGLLQVRMPLMSSFLSWPLLLSWVLQTPSSRIRFTPMPVLWCLVRHCARSRTGRCG